MKDPNKPSTDNQSNHPGHQHTGHGESRLPIQAVAHQPAKQNTKGTHQPGAPASEAATSNQPKEMIASQGRHQLPAKIASQQGQGLVQPMALREGQACVPQGCDNQQRKRLRVGCNAVCSPGILRLSGQRCLRCGTSRRASISASRECLHCLRKAVQGAAAVLSPDRWQRSGLSPAL